MSVDLAVVVPTCRPLAMVEWVRLWKKVFIGTGYPIFVVADMPWDSQDHRTFMCGVDRDGLNLHHLSWDDVNRNIKEIVPTKCDSVRNLGFIEAARAGALYIATLDDDVYPIDDLWAKRMLHNMRRRVDPYTFQPAPMKTRGFPSAPLLCDVMLHHGLWEGVPDVYAFDQLDCTPLDGGRYPVRTIPHGSLAPLSGMNLCFRRDLLPAMYFWPQDKFRRYGDIWCGLLVKKVIDCVDGAATSGSPNIYHSRMSDRLSNVTHEKKGEYTNYSLWSQFCRIPDKRFDSVEDATRYVINHLDPETLEDIGTALKPWVKYTSKLLEE